MGFQWQSAFLPLATRVHQLTEGVLLTLYPWLIPLINWGLGALQVKRTVVELTASACTFPGGTVGTDPEKGEKRERNSGEGREMEDRKGVGGEERIVMR